MHGWIVYELFHSLYYISSCHSIHEVRCDETTSIAGFLILLGIKGGGVK